MEAIRATQCTTHCIDRRCQASGPTPRRRGRADSGQAEQDVENAPMAGQWQPGGTLARHPIGRAEEPDDFCCPRPALPLTNAARFLILILSSISRVVSPASPHAAAVPSFFSCMPQCAAFSLTIQYSYCLFARPHGSA
ncbi:hypothetical protein TsFJ059_003958 [Trichoderma semiorbis]|uniref:Uncharacterized protein n=1 Tax=Trichoderma semiorbis TaxID=1491008 RepID=A0A9P8HSM5_9HYPO|nr:hypothetical protein TsFJ059_003958 [Trichoderma semiorbis]